MIAKATNAMPSLATYSLLTPSKGAAELSGRALCNSSMISRMSDVDADCIKLDWLYCS